MNFCAKCLQEVGDEAVFLRNGTHMCPACYQRAYPLKPVAEKPKRIDVSVEGVLTILAVAGLLILCYKAFELYQHSSHDAALQAIQQKEKERLELEHVERVEREAHERAIAATLAHEREAVAKKAELETQRSAAIAQKQNAEKSKISGRRACRPEESKCKSVDACGKYGGCGRAEKS